MRQSLQLYSLVSLCVFVCVCVCVCVCVPPSKFVQIITSTIVGGFQNNLTQLFSIMSRCAIWRFHSGRSKVKDIWARWVAPGQPFSMGKLCSKEVVISHNSNISLKNFGLVQVQNICETTKLNSLPNDNFLDWNKFKAFADDKCSKNELISIFYGA